MQYNVSLSSVYLLHFLCVCVRSGKNKFWGLVFSIVGPGDKVCKLFLGLAASAFTQCATSLAL